MKIKFILTGIILILLSVTSISLFADNNRDVPEWSVDPSAWDFDGTITAGVFLEGVQVGAEGDLVGAFVGEVCRGVASAMLFPPTETYVFLLQVYSNESSGEFLTFKYWNSNEDVIYDADETVEFIPDMTHGDGFNPFVLTIHTTIQYTITTSSSPPEGGTTTGGGTYEEGTECTVTATPNEHWSFINWTEDGVEVSTDAAYTFTVYSDRDLVANFELETFVITTTPSPYEGGTTTGDGTYNYGASCTVEAFPNTGWNFINWTEDGTEVSTDAAYTFTVDSDRDLVANFTEEDIPPTASFTADPTEGYQPLEVTFTNTSDLGTGELLSIFWLFGDGTYSPEWFPLPHVYENYGAYSVILMITTTVGTSVSPPTMINVWQSFPPVASFTADPTLGYAPLTVSFTNTSDPGTGSDITYLWDFGDGNASTEENPVHVYPDIGLYDVTLTVTTTHGENTSDPTTISVVQPFAILPDLEAEGCTSLSIPLTVNDLVELEGMDIVIEFDEYVLDATGATLIGGVLEGWDYGFFVNTDVDGQISLIFYAEADLFTGSGIVAYLEFHAYCCGFATPLTFTQFDVDEVSYLDNVTNGSVTCITSPPIASFTAEPTEGYQPLEVTFTNTSDPGTGCEVAYLWNFGDETTSTEENPVHVYPDFGSYDVYLTVTTSHGTDTSVPTTITVWEAIPPTASFTAEPTLGYAPLTVTFTNTSVIGTGDFISWLWDFGDETTSAEENPVHEYPDIGAYDVTLTVTTTHGTDTSDPTVITVVEPSAILPVINVDCGTSISIPLTVNDLVELEGMDIVVEFDEDVLDATGATLVGGVLEGWNYGFECNTAVDGEISLLFYAQTDLFTGSGVVAYLEFDAVCIGISTPLTFTQFDVDEVSYLDNVTNGYVTCNIIPPEASFTADPTEGFQPLEVTFTNTSDPGTGSDITYSWDFGDGNTSTEENPVHVYPDFGTYNVTLTVTTTHGTDTSDPTTITVLETIPPVASFTADPTLGYAALTVTFTNTSNPGTGWDITYLWDFGDGNTSSEENPVHEYPDIGEYYVTLTVETIHGTDTSDPTTITVVQPFAILPDLEAEGCTSLSIPLTVNDLVGLEGMDIVIEFDEYVLDATGATLVGGVLEGWNYGFFVNTEVDGQISLVFYAEADLFTGSGIVAYLEFHAYCCGFATPLTFTQFDVDEVDYLANTTDGSVTCITSPPIASFTAEPTEGYQPLEVTFTNTSDPGTGCEVAYFWDFGDGNTSTEENPVHLYPDFGDYDVYLTVTTSHGTDTSPTTTITVWETIPPTASFVAFPTSGFIPLFVTFINTSDLGTGELISCIWDFGDGETSSEWSPTHTYTEGGEFDVTVTVTTTHGTDTSPIITIDAWAPPTASFTAEPTLGYAPLTVTFTNTSDIGTGEFISWLWDFGDETTSAEENPVHVYPDIGEYDVTLTVETTHGTDTSDPTTINVVEPSAILPVINVDCGTSISIPLTVNDLVELEGMDIVVEFDEDVLDATGATLIGGVLEGWNYGFEYNTAVDGEISLLFYAQTDLFTGSGVVAYLEFHAVCIGITTPLTFTQFDVDEVSYLDNVTNGYVTCNIIPPVASFTAEPTEGYQPLEVTFTNTSDTGTGSDITYSWDFGDGETSAEENPAHVYPDVGSYDVYLTVTTSHGTNTSDPTTITVWETIPPTASFTADPTLGYAPLTVTFTNTSDPGTGSDITYYWDFGDGNTSTEENPVHDYPFVGFYDVYLTVTTTHGTDTSPPTTITVVQPSAILPDLEATGCTSLSIPLTVNDLVELEGMDIVIEFDEYVLDATGATLIGGVLEGWDYGFEYNIAVDGQISLVWYATADLFTGSGVVAYLEFHAYCCGFESPLTFTQFDVDEVSYLDNVTNGSVTCITSPPIASFTADPTEGYQPLEVTFTNTSDPGTGCDVAYLWDFGDETTSTEENPVHVYPDFGAYDVYLTVTTSHGTDTSDPTTITVWEAMPPTASFIADPTLGYAPLTVTFTNTSVIGTGEFISWLWDFGDETTSAEENPIHEYPDIGEYDVTLTVTTTHGTDTSDPTTISVVQPFAILPDMEIECGTSILIPLTVNDLVELEGMNMTITFNEDVLDATGATLTGGVLEGWDYGFECNTLVDGEIRLVWYATVDLFTGSGIVAYLEFDAICCGTIQTLTFTQFDVDEVSYLDNVTNGSVIYDIIPPVASFTADPTEGYSPLTVEFTNTSDPGTGCDITYLWDFGDGETSTEENPIHEYMYSGIYDATLTVETTHGIDTSDPTTIRVWYFDPVCPDGNPYLPMNIFISGATFEGINLDECYEIGIFDGDICVGAVALEGEIEEPLHVIACADDPTTEEIDGFINGHTIYYRLWNECEDELIVYVDVDYDPEYNDVFTNLGTAVVWLYGSTGIPQDIDLYYGWNIMSFYNRPYPMDMLDIVNPLIALDVLVKVQDEAGGTIVFLPGGWVNTIGDMAVTEGYYIRLNDDALLNTIGSPVMLPFDIPLLNGWNIMGYPVTGPQNALDAVQPLIDAGELVKVQSETGDAIINMPWGWINTIGNFEPGEGYNIKVNTNTYLTLNEPLIALSTSDISDEHSARQDGHFTPIHIGNPYLPMNICITSATINDINLGISDEISVFDGDICVGSKILAGEIDQFISIAVSTDDPITEEIDGFITGNQITYRVWDSSEQVEYTDVEVVYLPDYLNAFKSLETAVAEIKVYSIEATQLGGNYPNPFMAGTKINFSLREAGNVTIEIYNILGQKVRTLVDGYYTVNNHSEYWNGLDDNNQKVSNGIYFYKMTAGNYSSIKKMIMMK